MYSDGRSQTVANRPGAASEAGQVVRFHKLLAPVVQDVKPGGVLATSTTRSEDFKETADLLEAALEIGHRLIT